ncbi:transposase [Neolewinella antarctica]|uniref:Transposase IS701-like DDE domain-containing protein n=1 Tax=Neolewinella antarctica TaxID=442734 RepID=A0ABX0X5P9_9BACT|nr:transposase [Neolewinella antarctica]NJC24525.1 hypothetical protein [Neolewinella antarctica]
MTRLTKVTALAASILQQMPQIGKWQRKFLLLLFPLWLSIRGRHNFANLARYSVYGEGAFRHNFAKPFDWLTFNRLLCLRSLGPDRILAFDPSYLPKSGHYTEGVAKFWSGSARQVRPGLEISSIAAVDLADSTALHLEAFQTLPRGEGQTLLDYYAEGILSRQRQLKLISSYLVADAYFSKQPFVDKLTKAGFKLVSRLRCDARMRYLYQGTPTGKRGRPQKYDGRVNPRELRQDVFQLCGKDEDQRWIAYSAVVNIPSWKRSARVVIIHQLDEKGRITGHRTLVSSDTELAGTRLLIMYPARFHQEFLFRDAKQDLGLGLGLEHGQAYTADKIDFHINASLTVGSLAKISHHIEQEEHRSTPFSIADIKTEYVNEHQALRIISMFGISLNSPLIAQAMPKIRNYGKRRA